MIYFCVLTRWKFFLPAEITWSIYFQVKIWFQNRRAKERRSLKKQEDVLVKEKLECTFSPPGGHMGGGMEHHHPFSTASLMPPLPQHFSQCLSSSSFPPFMKFEWPLPSDYSA